MRSNSSNSRRSQDNSEVDDRMAINELRESLADRKSYVAKSSSKLRSQAPTIESHHSKRSNQELRKKVGLRLKTTGRNKGVDGAFDTKSLVSQRSMISKEQKREERSLNILTKRALNQLTDNSKRGDDSSYFTRSLLAHNPHQQVLQPHNGSTSRKATQSIIISHADSKERIKGDASESSSLIKQNIKRTMYSAFPDRKD